MTSGATKSPLGIILWVIVAIIISIVVLFFTGMNNNVEKATENFEKTPNDLVIDEPSVPARRGKKTFLGPKALPIDPNAYANVNELLNPNLESARTAVREEDHLLASKSYSDFFHIVEPKKLLNYQEDLQSFQQSCTTIKEHEAFASLIERKLVSLERATSPPKDTDLIYLYSMAAESLVKAAEFNKAERYITKALSLEDQRPGNPSREEASLHELSGNICLETEQFPSAVESYKSSLSIQESFYPNQIYNIMTIKMNLGRARFECGSLHQAKTIFTEIESDLEQHQLLLSPHELERIEAELFKNWSAYYVPKKDFSKSLEYAEKSLDLDRSYISSNSLGKSGITIPQVFFDESTPDEYRDLLDSVKTELTSDYSHPLIAQNYRLLGRAHFLSSSGAFTSIYKNRVATNEARKYFLKAAIIDFSHTGPNHAAYIYDLYKLGQIEKANLGRGNQKYFAKTLFENIIKIIEDMDPPNLYFQETLEATEKNLYQLHL